MQTLYHDGRSFYDLFCFLLIKGISSFFFSSPSSFLTFILPYIDHHLKYISRYSNLRILYNIKIPVIPKYRGFLQCHALQIFVLCCPQHKILPIFLILCEALCSWIPLSDFHRAIPIHIPQYCCSLNTLDIGHV